MRGERGMDEERGGTGEGRGGWLRGGGDGLRERVGDR